jgi:hypothetical protein
VVDVFQSSEYQLVVITCSNFSINSIPSVLFVHLVYFRIKFAQVCFQDFETQSRIWIFISTAQPNSVRTTSLSQIASHEIFKIF